MTLKKNTVFSWDDLPGDEVLGPQKRRGGLLHGPLDHSGQGEVTPEKRWRGAGNSDELFMEV